MEHTVQDSDPPHLEPRSHRKSGIPSRLVPVALFLGFLLLLGVVHVAQEFGLPWPQCGLRTLTGIPCPLCGGTRSLDACSKLELGRALALNPLVALTAWTFCAWFGLWLLGRCVRSDRPMRMLARFRRRPWPWIGIAMLLLNWVYLMIWLPKN